MFNCVLPGNSVSLQTCGMQYIGPDCLVRTHAKVNPTDKTVMGIRTSNIGNAVGEIGKISSEIVPVHISG